jgi:hypothetical protein
LSEQIGSYDPAQLETLLDPIQLMAAGHAVDLTPIMFRNVEGERRKQGMQLADQFLPFLFDGQQLFIAHWLPTTGKLTSGIAMELTSKCPSVYLVCNPPIPNNITTRRISSSQRQLVTIIWRVKGFVATLAGKPCIHARQRDSKDNNGNISVDLVS